MEILLTVVTAFLTFALGQISVKLIIDPVQEFKRTVADISHSVIEYANVYSNPGIAGPDKEEYVAYEFRKLSSRLNAQMSLIPCYRVWAWVFCLPKRPMVVKASGYLIGLSNGFGGSNPNRGILNTYKAQHLCDALGIYVSPKERLDRANEKDYL